ncbi:YadA C-terminal domain-containing protein, partial [Rosenbergiella australiborealis]|uniref:YadA C-terminal domain-containing protein n=1 Tax=Rosenbergiella australiborealis TaxID=1544696 RepID=UPI001F4E89CF
SSANTLSSANNYTDKSSANTLSSANNYTDKQIEKLNIQGDEKIRKLSNKIDQANKKLNAGIAGVTAIASIPYLNNNRFSYGMGGGTYSNGQAVAAGAQVHMTQNTAARVNISWDSSHNSAVGVGFAAGW